MILGLDASTTVCGWAMYDGQKVVDAGFIETEKLETNKNKAFHILKEIGKNPNVALISEVKLEAALSGFMGGRTSQQVVIKLARFNAVLEYIVGEHWSVPVRLINASTARKSVLGKAFVKGMKAKDYVRQELPKRIPYLSQFDKLNKKGEWNKKNEDMYDAIVIAMS